MSADLKLNTPAHQVLNNQEIVDLIVNEMSAGNSLERDLVPYVTLNKSFFHATTDTIWRYMPSASPFFHLLPQCTIEGGEEQEKDPWARFRVYHEKTVDLTIRNDNLQGHDVPIPWFLHLLNTNLRPPSIFPRLLSLRITSPITGANTILPLYVSRRRLSHIEIPGDRSSGGFEILDSTKHALASLIAHLAMRNDDLPPPTALTINSPSSPTFGSPLFSSLTELTVSHASPLTLNDLVHLNLLSNLKHLCLRTVGDVGRQSIPTTAYLKQLHPFQGMLSLTNLTIVGDACSTYWGTLLFACSSLKVYSVDVPRIIAKGLASMLLWRSLHIIALRSQKIREIRIYDRPEMGEDVLPTPPYFFIPDGVLPALSELHQLSSLDIVGVPFAGRDIIFDLLAAIKGLKKLSFLRLLPRPEVPRLTLVLTLPTFDFLKDIANSLPSLTTLISWVDASIVPDPEPRLGINAVKNILLVPRTVPQETMPRMVALAKYLDSAFPHLEDLTSHLESEHYQSITISPQVGKLWNDLHPLLELVKQGRTKP